MHEQYGVVWIFRLCSPEVLYFFPDEPKFFSKGVKYYENKWHSPGLFIFPSFDCVEMFIEIVEILDTSSSHHRDLLWLSFEQPTMNSRCKLYCRSIVWYFDSPCTKLGDVHPQTYVELTVARNRPELKTDFLESIDWIILITFLCVDTM